MSQFKVLDPHAKVNLEVVVSFVNVVMKDFKPIAEKILEDNGIKDPKPGEWCSQQKWLDALKSISEEIGEATLYKVGVVIPENTKSKPCYDKMFSSIQDLKAGLESIDVGYHMTHRGGDIGYYNLVEYNENERYAIMECNNSSSTHFDRGVIVGFVRMFKPEDSIEVKIELDETKPSKLKR